MNFKIAYVLKKEMSFFIDRSTLSLSDYMELTRLPVYCFPQLGTECSLGTSVAQYKSLGVFTDLINLNEADLEMKKFK